MILVDTSIWVDHLRNTEAQLVHLLERELVLSHPFVIGELALGQLRQRNKVLGLLSDLRHASIATHNEVTQFIDQKKIYGRGIGYVDAHLLASALLEAGVKLWTRDKRLQQIANEMDVGFS